MANKQKKKVSKFYDTDDAARNIWLCLLRDFRFREGAGFCEAAEDAFLLGTKDFREYKFPELGIIDPGRFKRYTQLSSFFKKYRFKSDAYDDQELFDITLSKFMLEQEEFGVFPPRSERSHRVLQRARSIARRILGSYDPTYTIDTARFGKKSSIGCPLSLAYIDEKLSNMRAFTGSTECSEWFLKDSLPGDPLLQELLQPILGNPQEKPDLQHDSLNLVLVPKTWKIHRPITPLTLLALYYSYGVGDQVTDALAADGLDISKLQNVHRSLARRFSCSRDTLNGGSHATVDLSSASQSLTSDLLNAILPREWYNACKKTFSHTLVIGDDKREFYSSSVLPMGNGLTFPVETLIFYCVIRAIGDLSGIDGIFSVYGDDLIYPSRLHKYVTQVFPELRLKLNLDKTFVSYPFRESCGSDFYRGVDVRPAFLPGSHRVLTATQYQAWLYQVYNGLKRRWDECAISGTLKFLLRELSSTSLVLHRVPPLYPDTSGICTSVPSEVPMGLNVLRWAPVGVVFAGGSRWYTFSFLNERTKNRYVRDAKPYYWLALQGLDDDIPPDGFRWGIRSEEVPFMARQQPLRWVTECRFTKCVSKKTQKSYTKKVKTKRLVCTARVSNPAYEKVKTKPGSISDWFQDVTPHC